MPPTFIELPSEPMQDIYRSVQANVELEAAFLITGETGVGKEGVAQYIRKQSSRTDKAFIAINCARLTSELLQNELFGHDKGAYTGADDQHKGAFERADGGILFLDEISEMPTEAQGMLLRVLDSQTFTRLGGGKSVEVDIQVIAATNKDLSKVIAKGEFRDDLYYRLLGVDLYIPPLRERTADIVPLTDVFLREFSPKQKNTVLQMTPEALAHLEQAAWPGNIRQLRNIIRTAVARATADTIDIKDLPFFTVPIEKIGDETRIRAESDDFFSIWQALSQEKQQAFIREFSKLQRKHQGETDIAEELLNIAGMTQNDILRAVAQLRLIACGSLRKAADSLGVDARTLQKHL